MYMAGIIYKKISLFQMGWILLSMATGILCYSGGYRESKQISGNMFNLSHNHLHFYSAGLCRSGRDNCQGPDKKLLGQGGTGFDGNDLPAAGNLCLHS